MLLNFPMIGNKMLRNAIMYTCLLFFRFSLSRALATLENWINLVPVPSNGIVLSFNG